MAGSTEGKGRAGYMGERLASLVRAAHAHQRVLSRSGNCRVFVDFALAPRPDTKAYHSGLSRAMHRSSAPILRCFPLARGTMYYKAKQSCYCTLPEDLIWHL